MMRPLHIHTREGIRPAIEIDFGNNVKHVYALVDDSQWSDAHAAYAGARRMADQLIANAIVTLIGHGYRMVERIEANERYPTAYRALRTLTERKARKLARAEARAHGKTCVITREGAVFWSNGAGTAQRVHSDVMQYAAELLAKKQLCTGQ